MISVGWSGKDEEKKEEKKEELETREDIQELMDDL